MTFSIQEMAASLHSSLRNTGGGTLDPRTRRQAVLRDGFLVSLRKYEKRFTHWPTVSEIATWLSDVAPAWIHAPNPLFPGIWYDHETLSVCCDLNVLVLDECLAIDLGRRERQQSIRNNRLAKNTSVQPARRAA